MKSLMTNSPLRLTLNSQQKQVQEVEDPEWFFDGNDYL